MNILHISPNFNYACGVSKHVYLLLKEFKKQNKHTLFFITNEGDSLGRLNDICVEPVIVKFKKDNRNLFLFIQFVIKLFLFCKKNKIDIIHTHHRVPELAAVIVSFFLRIRTITTIHSFVKGLKSVSFKSDKIIAVSRSVENYLINEYKVNRKKITTCYNFIEPFEEINEKKKFLFRKANNINDNDFVFLFLGRINFIKGCDVLIKAFNKINLDVRYKLILIGSYNLNEEYLRMIQNNESIIIKSPMKNISVPLFSSDVVILPSRYDLFPFFMLEAGMAKKPFIGGRTGGIAEIIEDGVDGLLVEPGNENDLLEKMMLLVNDGKFREKLAYNLYNKVQKLPTANEYINFIEKIYAETIN